MVPVIVLLSAVAAQPANPYTDALSEAAHYFAENGKTAHLKAVLDKHPDLLEAKRDQQLGKPSRGDGYTPLQTAAAAGKGEVVALLVGKKADVNAATGLGYTPLHLAAEGGHLDVVKRLVKAGAKVDLKTAVQPESIVPSGAPDAPPLKLPAVPARTALQLAQDRGHAEVVAFLKDAK